MPGIQMPSFADLSKEQKAIVEEADFTENFLVTGPPGTGKTVVAMWRARQASNYHTDDEINLFVYTNVLAKYSDNWSMQEDDVIVKTYHKWAKDFWKKHFGEEIPRIHGEQFVYDWPKMLKRLSDRELGLGHIILDEAQDHPQELYDSIGALDFIIRSSESNTPFTFGILADENQILDEAHNSSIEDIRQRINKFSEVPEFALTKNYRNTKQIAWLASKFYTGLDTGVPEFPERNGVLPVACGYNDLDAQVNRIVTYMKSNPTHAALVVTPRDPKRITKSLNTALKSQRNITVNGYSSYVKRKPYGIIISENEFSPSEKGAVTCVHWRSMKGLEADAVFAVDFNKHNYAEDGHIAEKRRFYVLASRARHYLEFMYENSEVKCKMLQLLKKMSSGTFDGKNQQLVEWK